MIKAMLSKLNNQQGTYDLPFMNDGGGRFLLLVIAIMVFLATLTLNAGTRLSIMTKSLSDGVVNKATVEIIPNVEADDFDIDQETAKVLAFLQKIPAIKQTRLLNQTEIEKMLEPWIGQGISSEVIPLPRVVSIEFLDLENGVRIIKERLPSVSSQARLDTHDSWTTSVLTLSGTLKAITFIIISIITVAMVSMVGAGIYARIQIYKDEVELLHLIGARDIYVAKQFQRHAFWISLQAGIIGFFMGTVFYSITSFVLAKSLSFDGVSGFSLSYIILSFVGLLAFVISLSVITARITVLRSLAKLS